MKLQTLIEGIETKCSAYGLINLLTYMFSRILISRSWWDYFLQVQITRSVNYFALRVIWTCKKSPQRQISVGESNQNVFLIQKDASNFAESEISEFDIEIRLYIQLLLLLGLDIYERLGVTQPEVTFETDRSKAIIPSCL